MAYNENITGNAATATLANTVTTNANLTGGVTSVGNAATVITNANLTGAVTSSGNATTFSGIVPLANGGLNANNAASTGTILRGNGTAYVSTTSAFADTYSANTVLVSNSANTVIGSSTLPSAVQTNITQVGAVPNTITGLIAGSNPGSGVLGQTLKAAVAQVSAISVSSGVVTNIASILLTAGVWDVNAVICGLGATTGTQIGGSLTITSGGTGTLGDTFVTNPFTTMNNSDTTLVIPGARFTLSSPTTLFMTGSITYTVGAGKLYGRLSATRVG